MKRVAIAAAHDLPADHTWEASAGDLAIAASREILEKAHVDAIFLAAPAALTVEGQANVGAVIADRLGLSGKCAVYTLDAGDGSGGAALHSAYAYVAAGLCRNALVLGVAKVSDLSERERNTLLDALIDREVEGGLGLTYTALAGLLADRYLQTYGLKPSTFAHVIAKNAANAVAGGESFLPHAPSAAELIRDIPVAPPLVRSDFAPLFDGASAVLLTELGAAKELTPKPVEILSVAAASDWSVIADRKDPLRLAAAGQAATEALSRAGGTLDALSFVEIQNACTVLEILALETLGITPPGKTGALCKENFGRLASDRVINPSGGAQGRGFAFGASGIAQAREAFLQLGSGAGKRQVAAAEKPFARALSLALSGLGSQAFATVFGRVS